jgi:hypothetical protein
MAEKPRGSPPFLERPQSWYQFNGLGKACKHNATEQKRVCVLGCYLEPSSLDEMQSKKLGR